MKKIGMVVAVEMKAVAAKYGDRCETLSRRGFEVKKCTDETYELYILHSGAGQIAAAAGTQFLIDHFDVDLVVNFGVVGALVPGLKKGELCVVDRVVHYDFDTSAVDHCEVGRYMHYPSRFMETDAALRRRTSELFPQYRHVTCASGDKFFDTAEQKRTLHQAFDAEICEMEAAAILMTCDRSGIPSLMVKIVSDSIDGGAEEYHLEMETVSQQCLEIVDQLIAEIGGRSKSAK